MDSSNLKQINELQADKALEATKHAETIGHLDNVAQTVLSATSSLIQYLEGHTTKTEVVNQLQSISTPDVEYVVKAVNILDDTLKARPLTDLSEITQLMRSTLAEIQAIPKSLPEQVTPEVIDYSERFAALEKAVTAVTAAVKTQDLHVDAPVVNVPEPNVHVAAPDLKPLETASKQVEKTIKLGQDEQRQAASKTASGLVTEQFDEYKITYSVPFDDEKPVVTGTKYYLKGKLVVSVKYSYNTAGDLMGAKKS